MFEKKIIYFIILFFQIIYMMSIQTRADSISANVDIYTDKERNIVLETIPNTENATDKNIQTIAVNKKETKSFLFDEPGVFQYFVYEDPNTSDRDKNKYVLSIYVTYDENQEKFETPNIIIDNSDGSGKPNELRFGITDHKKKTDDDGSRKKKQTDSSTNKNDNNRKSENVNFLSSVKTGDNNLLMLCLTMSVLSLSGGVISIVRRIKQDD